MAKSSPANPNPIRGVESSTGLLNLMRGKMIYQHEKSFGNLLVFDHAGYEFCLLKYFIETDDELKGVVGFVFIGRTCKPIDHNSPEFILARQIWREKA